MHTRPFVKNRLYCPGPTPVPLGVAISSLQTNTYHRTEAFREKLLECRKLLQPFFASKEAPLILTSSGTGAMEAALVNLTNPGDKIVVIDGGKFGERWWKMGSAYQCQVIHYKIPWGSSPDIAQLKQLLLENSDVKAVFFQANETSTGVAYPVKQIAAAIREVSRALIVVDAISALVAHRLELENWGIDCLLSGSQKGFGIPPGLAFIALSENAWKGLSQRPRFYFDLKKEREGQNKGETAWTPATTLIETLLPALSVLAEMGPDTCEAHHKRLAAACRAAMEALELSLFSKDHHSQALTAVSLPETIDGSALVRVCRERFGTIFAGGQDQVKGKIVRIAHLGMIDELDLLTGLTAFEMGLASQGHKAKLGLGIGAAMKVLTES